MTKYSVRKVCWLFVLAVLTVGCSNQAAPASQAESVVAEIQQSEDTSEESGTDSAENSKDSGTDSAGNDSGTEITPENTAPTTSPGEVSDTTASDRSGLQDEAAENEAAKGDSAPEEQTAANEETAPENGSDDIVCLEDIPPYSGEPIVIMHENRPLFSEDQIKAEAFEEYGTLDELGRATGAFVCVTQELMPTESRSGGIFIKPSGWHTVKYDGIDGNYLYNRCHLVAYQLTAETDNESNLVTGTRYMNIEGMQPLEDYVAQHIKSTGHHVLYRATPMYEGNDLLAKGVLLESQCVEEPESELTFCVFCYNVQPGIEIDYATGESAGPEFTGTWQGTGAAENENAATANDSQADTFNAAGEEGRSDARESAQENAIPEGVTYIGNKRSLKLHKPTCKSVTAMKEKNKKYFTVPLEQILPIYTPCENCMKEEKYNDPRKKQ